MVPSVSVLTGFDCIIVLHTSFFMGLRSSCLEVISSYSLPLVSIPKHNENNIYAIEDKIKHSMWKRQKNNVTTNQDKVNDEKWKKWNYFLFLF